MICRFCRGDENADGHGAMMKYSTRCNAHTDCLIKAKGEDFVIGLPVGWLGRASMLAFSGPGLMKAMAKIRADVRKEWPRSPRKKP